jgi:hypothetical protein
MLEDEACECYDGLQQEQARVYRDRPDHILSPPPDRPAPDA